ncbi:lysine biosynthesis protein LysX [Patescibacteria group bacterium]|nr:lysine biosynthesis protein LysX [Patescibacteria group bacterium]
MKIGFLHSLIRKEEKLLLQEFRKRPNVNLVMLDDREVSFHLGQNGFNIDLLLERCINHSRALYAIRLFEGMGIRCINNYHTASICGDKLLTSATLQENNVPQPEVRIAFTEKSAIKAIEEMGYPVVLKPVVGSWGRLIAKINDKDSAEAILEHKTVLGSYQHSIFYLQKYIEKKGRDIRSFVIGDECICAIYRTSEHWKTNTALGAKTSNCEVTDEIREISLTAARAVKGDIVAIDLFESDGSILVNEINYTMEFKNSIDITGVNIPGKIVDYVLKQAKLKS